MNAARQQGDTLDGISQIRGFFRTNEQPIYFVSPTAFNLLGIDRTVKSFYYVNWFDSFDGTHPRVFVPRDRPMRDFRSMEDVCNALIAHDEVRTWASRHGSRPKVCLVMFDEETERLAEEAGMELILPSAALRRRIDSKIVTTRIGDEAGVPSAPNVLGRAGSYHELTALAAGRGLGDDLVVQTPYGDSGKTTFFIARPRGARPPGSAIASPRRATGGSSRSITSSTVTRVSCIWASSTPGSAASRRSRTSPRPPMPTCRCSPFTSWSSWMSTTGWTWPRSTSDGAARSCLTPGLRR
jgi:hypothetical protein